MIAARHRRAADVRRRRDDRDTDRPAAGVRAGSAGRPLRRLGRQAGPRERGPEPGANGVHGRRRHDRPRADHVRRGDRPGLQELVHRCRQHALHRRLLGLGRRQRRPAHEQGRRCRRDRARRHGGVADALRRGQGRRQDRLRHRRRREPDEGHRRHMDEAARTPFPSSSARRCVRARPVRGRPLADDRLAARDRDADRQDHPRPRHRHRRSAQGRLAVRRDLGVQGDLRRVVRKPRQRVHVREHPGRAVRGEHGGARDEPRRVPGRRRRDAR